MNAYGVISLVQLIALLQLNPVRCVIPGLREGTCCAVLRGSLLIVWN